MKSIKFILALAVVAMLFGSCQKEGQYNPSKKIKKLTTTVQRDGVTSDNESGYAEYIWDGNKLSSVNYYSSKGEIDKVQRYYYDSKNRVESIESSTDNTLKYSYNGNYLETIKHYRNEILYFTYNVKHNGNKISEIIVEQSDEASSEKAGEMVPCEINPFFFFPEEVSSAINKSVENSFTKGQTVKTYTLTWKNNNITKLGIVQGGITTTNEYTYDNKNNPFYGWLCIWSQSVDDMFSKNNVTTISGKTVSGAGESSGSIEFTYEYSSSFPKTKKYTDKDYYGEYKTVMEYEYY